MIEICCSIYEQQYKSISDKIRKQFFLINYVFQSPKLNKS